MPLANSMGDPPLDPSLLRAIARMLLEQEQAEEHIQRLRSLDNSTDSSTRPVIPSGHPASLQRRRRSGERKP